MNPRHDPRGLPVVRVSDIPIDSVPRRWLIEGLWGAAAVGFIGGPPKCCKSYLGLDMALSVATGTPCLGTYAVREPGPALAYLAEDALSVVRERVAALARHRGIAFGEVNLHVITAPRLRLDQPADGHRLLATAQRLRPRLLLLDPLVRLHAVDENNATEVARLLVGLRDLQRRLDLAVVLVHHTRKAVPAGLQAGQGLRGSTDLHAFGDSNLYLRRQRGDLLLSMEHRAAAAPDPVALELVTTDEQTIHLKVTRSGPPFDAPHHDNHLDRAVLEVLERQPAMTRHALREELAVQNERLGRTLLRLERQGQIQRGPNGWRRCDPGSVPRSPPYEEERNGTPHEPKALHHRESHHGLPGETESGSAGTQPDKG